MIGHLMKGRWLFPFSVLWLLALCVVATIGIAWLTYPFEIGFLHLTDVVDLTKDTIWHNFNQLMTYLTNPLISKLSMADFPSSAMGLKHFRDVKHLFQLAHVIAMGVSPFAIVFFYRQIKHRSLFCYWYILTVMAMLPLFFLGMAVLVGFDNFFTLFHKVLFPKDTTWIFDPLVDPVIYILPEELFLHYFVVFFFLYEFTFWSLVCLARYQLKKRLEKA
ncbi:TIGR01906 family membrane protein [Streptococcus sciuri]|uniref:TIGR01906 family membrane protein n=1 Tax=Streptococcus sciuri TaxID=2973939 RepID=A0ABT2F5K5_9STRE|nr:TIGR01906 family membrane protein [Streptococcus sciuri]MCS4487468.1 TIGR01906 family membrane protein [Streptococcus sciuri]